MVLGAILRFPKTNPFAFGCAFSCAKTSFSDWLVQTQVEKREHIDWKRNATFASFGLFYLGGVQYALYVPIFGRVFPGAGTFATASIKQKLADPVGCRNLVAQVFIDQFVHHPLLYFPVFYCLKEAVNLGTYEGALEGGLAKYSKNYQEDLIALWKLWVPSTFINFAFMPMFLRIPWVASTSLIWTCILSAMRGGNDMETSQEEAMNYVGGQGSSLMALYDLGISTKPAYQYDKSKSHMLVTASGRDRVGFIHQVADVIATRQGNILDVKAYKVGRDFVTVMLVEAQPSYESKLNKELKQLSSDGMQIAVQPTQPWLADTDSPRCKDGVTYTGHFRANGPDRPGLLTAITEMLAAEGLDIMSFSCNQHLHTKIGHGGEPNAVEQHAQITGVVRAFSPVNRALLNERLIAFENKFNIRMGVTETAPDPSFSAFTSAEKKRSLVRTMSENMGGKKE